MPQQKYSIMAFTDNFPYVFYGSKETNENNLPSNPNFQKVTSDKNILKLKNIHGTKLASCRSHSSLMAVVHLDCFNF